MYKYKLYYDGGFLRDSEELGYIYESEEEATEEAKLDIENYINDWESEGVTDTDVDLFKVRIMEVWV